MGLLNKVQGLGEEKNIQTSGHICDLCQSRCEILDTRSLVALWSIRQQDTLEPKTAYDTLSDKGYTSVTRRPRNSDASQDALKLLQDSSFYR